MAREWKSYVVPSTIVLYLILLLGTVSFLHLYIKAYREQTHKHETALYLIEDTCVDASKTIRTGLVGQCHDARHMVEDSVWHLALVKLLLPENAGKGWIFLEFFFLAGLILLAAGVIFCLRGLERGSHFSGPVMPVRMGSQRASKWKNN